MVSFDSERPSDLWQGHVRSIQRQIGSVVGASLFSWLAGDTALMALYDVELKAAPTVAGILASSLRADIGARVSEVTAYREVFAAPGAGPIEKSSGYIHMPLVDFSADESTEAEFNRWYDETHIPELVPAGLLHARRFKASRATWQYAATYEMDSPKVLQSEALAKIRGFGAYSIYVKSLKRVLLKRVHTRL